MSGEQLLFELIKITDMKIDLLEYAVEKLSSLPMIEQKQFVMSSSVFDKMDWLNIEFMTHYDHFLHFEKIRELSQIAIDKYAALKDLKHLVTYAFELESGLDEILSKIR